MAEHVFVVGRNDVDQTVAAFLRLRLQLTWSEAKNLVASGVVRVASQKVSDPAFRLKLGKKVEIIQPKPAAKENEWAAKPFQDTKKADAKPTKSVKPVKIRKPDELLPTIIYSDDTIVVVDKPTGLTTMRHPEEAAEFGEHAQQFLPTTLADMLPAMLGRPGKQVKAVHRIDNETSGLVVFARTKIAQEHLDEQFREHRIERRYQALARGKVKPGKIETTIVRDRGDGRRGTGTGEGAKTATTKVKVLERFHEFSFIECQLETGRTHQIRIHLGEQGTPLCGETIYDRPINGQPLPDKSGAKRIKLHAAVLGLVHPVTGEKLRWEAPLPEDFRQILNRLRAESAELYAE
ncbi:MAG: RluA family pseudouridine synthase [Zavarzinella sp.]